MSEGIGHLFGTALSFGLVLYFIYRRFRRNFGRQPLKRSRLKLRIGVLAIIGGLLLIPTFLSTSSLMATALSIGIGVALALWAARYTRFEKEDNKLYYIPHTYVGMVVTALFLGRIIYHVAVVSHSAYSMVGVEAAGVSPRDFGGFSAVYQNPITRCVFYILAGYYCYYYWYVLHEAKRLKAEDGGKKTLSSTTGGDVN